MNWFLYDNGLRHERVKCITIFKSVSLRASLFKLDKYEKISTHLSRPQDEYMPNVVSRTWFTFDDFRKILRTH